MKIKLLTDFSLIMTNKMTEKSNNSKDNLSLWILKKFMNEKDCKLYLIRKKEFTEIKF
ncbi:MAG: hypothetical protein U5K55_10085 [Aliarcobacter sp.]|nr:hypothetical protein [Aliarcobacter sp.]